MSKKHSKKRGGDEYVYGIHAVESMLHHKPDKILKIHIQADKDEKRLKPVLMLANKHGISVETLANNKMNELCDGQRHQGVIAVVKRISSTADLESFLDRDNAFLLLLDEVQDPHNIGACLRSADAAGVDAVVVSKNRSPGLTAAVRKVSSGAADTVPFIQVSNLVRAIQLLRDNGFWVLGASGYSDNTIYNVNTANKIALVMGSEGKGLRRLTEENCDELVSIPMYGKVESLNVSVATGICLFEIKRKIMLQT